MYSTGVYVCDSHLVSVQKLGGDYTVLFQKNMYQNALFVKIY